MTRNIDLKLHINNLSQHIYKRDVLVPANGHGAVPNGASL